MCPADDVEAESFLSTKRWFPKHPELGPPNQMPMEPFVSEEQFALEREHLWPHVWLMVGRVEEIAEPGDYLIKEIPTNHVSLIVVRGRDGVIRAFHNICSHRGAPVCWEKSGGTGTTAAFRCPYHGFTFGLEGKLQFVPDEENFYDLDKGKMGLKPVTLDTWEGFIFVHLDPNPRETLKEYLGGVVDGLEGYPFHNESYFYEYKCVVHCNWKVLIAGFLETFHGGFLHAGSRLGGGTLNPFRHPHFIKLPEKHRMIASYRNPDRTPTRLGSIVYSRYNKMVKLNKHEAAPTSDSSDNADAFKAITGKPYVIHNIFPNFQLNTRDGMWYRHQFWPLSADEVLWEVRYFYVKPKNATQAFYHYFNRSLSRDNLIEDGNVSERSQWILKSGLIDHWMLQDEEVAIRHFNKIVADYCMSQHVAASG